MFGTPAEPISCPWAVHGLLNYLDNCPVEKEPVGALKQFYKACYKIIINA